MTQDELFSKLWDELVPESGEAETVQGELVRSFGRLEGEWKRNSNWNWDNTFYLEMLGTLWSNLVTEETEDDGDNEDEETIDGVVKPFDADREEQIKQDLRLIGMLGVLVLHGHTTDEQYDRILQIFSSGESEENYNESFDRVRDAIIDWCRSNPKLRPRLSFNAKPDDELGSIEHLFE